MGYRRNGCVCKMAVAMTCVGILVVIRRHHNYNISFRSRVHRIYKDMIHLQNPVFQHKMTWRDYSNITWRSYSNFTGKNLTDTRAFVQYERHRLLAEACKKYPELSKGKLTVDTQRHILVNEKQKLLYCFVPKVACSNWKRVMMKLAGTTSKKLSRITSHDAHAKNGLRNLLNYGQNERRTILATYTAFMYARDPFARIVSAYKNKFGDVNVYRKETLIHKTAKLMIKKYRKDPSAKALETGENVTWTEFVSFLTDPVKNYFNEHWREMFKLCSPCLVNYDFLGHLETLDDDVQYMFQELHLEDKIKYPSSKTSHPTNSTNTYLEFYMQLTTEQIHRLWKIYEKDFHLFGYPKPNFVSST